MEVLRDLSSDVFRSAVKDFVDDYLGRAAIFDSMDDIVTEVVQTILSPLVSKRMSLIHTHMYIYMYAPGCVDVHVSWCVDTDPGACINE